MDEGALAAVLLALAACSEPPGSASPVASGPSVLLVTLDTTRADHIGAYGYPLATTPTLDGLAAAGTRFERAYSTCPLTIPSHATILTGRAPPSHGVRDNGDFVLGDDAVTLAERFSAAGWTTAAFTAAFPTQRRWGLAQGFEVYHDPLDRLPTQLDWSDQRRADEVVDDALATLSGLDGPVFAWVHLFDAHWPYDPPEPHLSDHDGRPYDGEIAFADAQLGRLLSWWDAAHPDSVVLVTADHGEGLGDGGEQTHGFLLHDGTIRVPLILRGRGVAAGAVVADPVSHVDIAPTLLGLAGLSPPAGVQGVDLRQGGTAQAYSEALTGQFNLGLAPLFALTGPDGRYTEGGWGAFYPLLPHAGAVSTVADPDDGGPPLDARRAQLAATRARLDEVVAPRVALDAEALEMLTALGYLGGDPGASAGDMDPRDVIDAIPLTWRVRQLMGQGMFARAASLVERLEERMPGTFGVQLLRAQLLRARGRSDEASAAFTELFLRSPSSTLALQLAGLAAARADPVEAEEWAREAFRLQPASPEAMAGIVRALTAQGRLAEAEDLADRFLVQYPDHAHLSLIRAELLLQTDRPEAAVTEAETALRAMPRSPAANAVLGGARWEMGRPDDAIDLLFEAVRLDPWDFTIRTRLATCLLEVRRHAEAVRITAPMARLAPEDPDLVGLHARALAALEAERAGRPPDPLADSEPP